MENKTAQGQKVSTIAGLVPVNGPVPHTVMDNIILVGDAGEEDPEIYSQVIQSFPSRILSVYIRNVKHDPKRVDDIRRLADQVESYGSMLVFAEDAQAMAGHAAQQGWIVSSAASQPVE